MKKIGGNWIRRKWFALRDIFYPQNRWARKAIPRHFTDVDGIFEDVLFNGLIFFWEEDRGEETMRYQYEYDWSDLGSGAEQHRAEAKEIYDLMRDAYTWAYERQGQYKGLYLAENLLDEESKLNAEDTKHLQNIIKYRKYLWS